MQRALAALLPDGRRLHLQHGPIDLIVEVFGRGRKAAFGRAAQRFETVLDELVGDLTELRRDSAAADDVVGPVAQRMVTAVAPFGNVFITPMAAVAGAVADEILAEITADAGVAKAYVNNGGDVALHLARGQRFEAAVAADPPARISLSGAMDIGGIATSGWGGRSHSLGIADNVTVLARSAAAADAAATLIANAVDLPGHGGITRQPASELTPDSDLGEQLVTVAVDRLSQAEKDQALSGGINRARHYLGLGLIDAAFLLLQGEARDVGAADLIAAAPPPLRATSRRVARSDR